jgi:phosphatidylglycerol:prolipoprotein diacylglycerol transferase
VRVEARGLLHPDAVHPELAVVVGETRVVVAAHGVAIVVGIAAGAALAARRAGRGVLPVVAVVAVAALVGSRVCFALLHGGARDLRLGGLASTGGVAAGLAAAWLAARMSGRAPAATLDVVAPAGLLALGIGRIGCFLGGCCYGTPTTLPWGLVLPDLGPPARHPLALYSAAGDLALVALLPARTAAPGGVARRAAFAFAALRGGLEWLRDPATTDRLSGTPLTVPQAATLVLALAATVSALRRRRPSTMRPRTEEPRAWRTRSR